jgi:DNA-binding transcriptional ArsR family regulator
MGKLHRRFLALGSFSDEFNKHGDLLPLDVYQAIADPNRRKLLELLSHDERSVQELMPYFDVTLGAISQHLKVLLDGRLVERRKQGRFRFYRTRPQRLKEVYDWTQQYVQF